MLSWFNKVIFTCTVCGTRQRIPLRRIHFFERFHSLNEGQAILILCPKCYEGLQTPSPYRTHNGNDIAVDHENPPKSAFVHGVLPGSP
jgi:hypothetical protein